MVKTGFYGVQEFVGFIFRSILSLLNILIRTKLALVKPSLRITAPLILFLDRVNIV